MGPLTISPILNPSTFELVNKNVPKSLFKLFIPGFKFLDISINKGLFNNLNIS